MNPSQSIALLRNTAILRKGRRIGNINDFRFKKDVITKAPSHHIQRFYSKSLPGQAFVSPKKSYKRSLSLAVHTYRRRQFSSVADDPWRVAIVGSGPSGCYTAKYLMAGISKLENEPSLSIDVIERLPTPYGLVRNGVAPDHPEVKNVQNDFDALFEAKDEVNSSIGFFGNVMVGGTDSSETVSDVALDELRELYDIVVLAYGCESDRELDLPVDILDEDGSISETDISSSTIDGILSAREFVNWYNGHPDYEWVTQHVQKALDNGKDRQSIVVVGHGNVALDCARILAKNRATLDPTDLTSRALDILHPKSQNNKRTISVVGRRGHVQAAFTIKEVRELTKLTETDNAQLILRQDELELGASTTASQEELKARPRSRIHKLLEGHSSKHKVDNDIPTDVQLRFLTNPIRFQSVKDETSCQLKLSSVVCERTKLEGDTPGSQSAVGTGVTESIDADLCLVSIGYKGLPIDESTSKSFDSKRGVLQNEHGRVATENVTNRAPLYVSGWLKRGPSGIIGTNIGDAKDTVMSILNDLKSGAISKSTMESSSSPLEDLLKECNVRFVDWNAYRKIEDCESSEKRHPDQPREKIVDREKLLTAAEV